MKKLFLLMMLVVATISFIFAQESSSSLLKARNKEIKKIEKQNLPPEEISTQKKVANDFYQPLIDSAMARESRGVNKTQQNQKIEQNQQQGKNIGGSFFTPNFQGGSLNVVNASNSYATVITAEAQAYMTKTVADNYKNGNYTSDLNNENLFKCLLRNEDEFTVVFTIIGMNGYRISVNVSGRSSLEVNLLPGNYSITTQIMLNGYSESKPVIKQVGNPMIYSIYGNEKYSFVLTNPNI